jgi:hypothetical protein
MAREWIWLDEDVDEVVATVLRRYYRQMQCSGAMVAEFSGFNLTRLVAVLCDDCLNA